MYAFNYHKPTSLAEVQSLLAKAEDGKLLAGGHTYIPTLKQRLAQPSDVIDLSGVAELKGIEEEAGGVTIGAMTTHGQIARSEIVRRVIPGLAGMAAVVGDPQVRNRGTMGGALANNDPASDYPGAVIGLAATIRTDKREIAGDDFITGMFETALEDGEIITAITFSAPDKCAYSKFPNPASRYAMAGVFVAKSGDGVRVGVTGAGSDGVFRWSEAEAALGSDFSAGALDGLSVDEGGMLSDIHGDAAYRANLVKVMAKRAVEAA